MSTTISNRTPFSQRKLRALAPLVLLPAALVAADAPYETAGPLPASRFLAANELAGPEWKVAPQAQNDGIVNTYTVESRFGKLEARGRTQLGFRVKEVDAMVELENVSKSKVFVDAVAASALAPVKVVASFAEQPGETVKGIGGGVRRAFGKTKFQVQEMSHDAKEAVDEAKESSGDGGSGGGESSTDKAKEASTAYAKKYLGLSGAERRWYAELGVDPHTDNEPLRRAVKEVSRVEAAAKFGMKFVGLPTIPGAAEIGKVMDLVWKVDPWELRKRNREVLLGVGVSKEVARRFEDNPALSPTHQTLIVQSLQDLQGVSGREQLIARGIDVETADQARMLSSATALLVRFHRTAPLAAILGGSRLPAARARDGGLVAVAAVDAIFWTEDVADAAREFAGIYAGEKAAKRELRVVGEASPRFKSEAKALGWEVLDRWQSAAPEDAAAR